MPLTDTRQASRLRSLPQVPSYPSPPDLARAYTEHKTNGLTEVFRRYDQNNRDWAARVARTHQTAQQATLDALKLSSVVIRPNAGWCVYDFVRREGTDSLTTFGYGRQIAVNPTEWRESWLTQYGNTWLGQSGWTVSKYASSLSVAAPRTFIVSFNEEPLVSYRPIGRLVPQFHLIPGDSILLPSGGTISAVTDAVRTVSRRISAGSYVVWLESAETVSPAEVAELHVGAILVSLQ